jgi:hypothetical protein
MTDRLPCWEERPREVANLFNPAFTSLLLSRTLGGYTSGDAPGMPLVLTYLVLPIVLHPDTRDALPRAASTTMYGWIAEHPHLKALFPARARRSVPFTQEAIRFGIMYGKLAITADALGPGALRYAQSAMPPDATDDVRLCLQKAAFLGRWFAETESPRTILATWGIRP